jgi:LPS export ABC transporter protein LptC
MTTLKRVGGVLLVLATAGALLAQDNLPEMTGFKVPEFDKDGNKKSEMTGDFARMKPNGDVDITNLRIDFFKDGDVATRVTAPQCTYNQDKGTAESDSSVRMARENMVVTGVGFRWNKTNDVIQIFNQARVVVRNLKADVLPAPEGGAE